MKTLPLIALLLGSLNSFSQSKPKSGVYPLPSKVWPTKTVAMDNIVTGIRFIQLETKPECLIGEINGFYQTGRGIYILTRDMKLMHFDPVGKFIWSINSKGKGPGEYNHVFGFTVTDKELILMDSPGKKLIVYNLDGMFIREITHITTGFGIAYLGNNRVAMRYGRASTSTDHQGELAIVNLNGTIENSYFPFDKNEGMSVFSSFTMGSDGKVFYHPDLDPTVYEIFGNAIDTLLRFDFKLPAVHSFREMGEAAAYIGIRRITDTKTTFAAMLQSKSENTVWLWDHKSGNSKLFYAESGSGLGFYHGFPVFSPAWSNREEFIDIEDGVQMKEILGKIDPGNLAWLRKNVHGFSNLEKIREDDNPVLVLYRFREF